MAGGDSPSEEDQGSLQQQPAMTFSDTIDAIGMGPFQNRLVIMCGMVSTSSFAPNDRRTCTAEFITNVFGLLSCLVLAGA